MTVRELLARTDSVELSEWIALYQIEADEQKRQTLRAKAEAKNQARAPGRGR
tara:strand:+ start:3647 stop:3802 length:156 start_codon:yes stop_codon:yes gene_type:complete